MKRSKGKLRERWFIRRDALYGQVPSDMCLFCLFSSLPFFKEILVSKPYSHIRTILCSSQYALRRGTGMGSSVINRMTALHHFQGFIKSLSADGEELLCPCNCVHRSPVLSLVLAISSFPVACVLGFLIQICLLYPQECVLM